MKEKKFGSKHNTPGVNLANIVRDKDGEIGIPESRIPEAIEIIGEALNDPELLEICCRGLGLGRPRETQKQIAEEKEMTISVISRMADKIISKLEENPWRNRLLALVPSIEELMRAYERQNVQNAQNRQIAGQKRQIEGLKEENRELREENEKLQEELKQEQAGSAALRKQLGDAARSLSNINARQAQKASEVAERLAEIYANANRQAEQVIGETFGTSLKTIVGDELAGRLSTIGINDPLALTRMSRRNLAMMKFRGEEIDMIARGMENHGLALRNVS